MSFTDLSPTMLKALRTGAVISVLLGVLTLFAQVRGNVISGRELIVSSKYTSESGSGLQFRISSELQYPQRGLTYDTSVSRPFYDAAKTGDGLRSPVGGYLKLMRDGRVVARYFSKELIVPAVYALVALLPAVVFLRSERWPMRRVLMSVVGVLEIVVIGVIVHATTLA